MKTNKSYNLSLTVIAEMLSRVVPVVKDLRLNFYKKLSSGYSLTGLFCVLNIFPFLDLELKVKQTLS